MSTEELDDRELLQSLLYGEDEEDDERLQLVLEKVSSVLAGEGLTNLQVIRITAALLAHSTLSFGTENGLPMKEILRIGGVMFAETLSIFVGRLNEAMVAGIETPEG